MKLAYIYSLSELGCIKSGQIKLRLVEIVWMDLLIILCCAIFTSGLVVEKLYASQWQLGPRQKEAHTII